jgi:hypothetical protein
MRIVKTMSGYHGEPALAGLWLNELGLPPFDIYTARSMDSEISYCIAGDAIAVLDKLASPVEVSA